MGHSEKGTQKSRLFLMNGWQNVTPWLRNGNCLITQSQNSTPGWQQIVEQKVNKTSLWKRWSPLLENSKTSSKRRRSLSKTCKFILQIFYQQTNLYLYNNKIGHHVGIHYKKYFKFLETPCVLKIRLF